MTEPKKGRHLPYLAMLFLSVPFFFLNIQDVHGWGDDFSLYIKEAQNILAGRPFNSFTWQYNPSNPDYSPPQYPAGYPLMLAPVIGISGLSFRALNYLNSLLAACLLFALYGYFRNYAGRAVSVLFAVFISYCGQMVSLKSEVLADLPCMLFITLYLWVREAGANTTRRAILLIVLAVCAIQCRSQAICLLIGEVVLLGINGVREAVRQRKVPARYVLSQPQAIIVPGALIVNFLVGAFIFPTQVSTMPFYYNILRREIEARGLSSLITDAVTSMEFTSTLFFLFPETGAFERISGFIASVTVWVAITGGCIKMYNKATISDLFFLVMLGMLTYFPAKDPRYFIPMLPVFVLYGYFALRKLLSIVPGKAAIGAGTLLAVLCTLPVLANLKFMATYHPSGCIPARREEDAFGYISEHIGDSDIIVFAKPRVLALFTGKRTINMSWRLSLEMNKRIFDSMGVRYMLVLNGLDDGCFHDYLRNVSRPVDSVTIGNGYMLYSLR